MEHTLREGEPSRARRSQFDCSWCGKPIRAGAARRAELQAMPSHGRMHIDCVGAVHAVCDSVLLDGNRVASDVGERLA